MNITREKIQKQLASDLLPLNIKVILRDKLLKLEIEEKVGKPGYEKLTSYYGKGEGLEFIKSYVQSLMLSEGFGVGLAIAQFDSNF